MRISWKAIRLTTVIARIRRRDHTIEATGEDILTSTHDHFHLIVNLDIKMDGLPYFSKNWTKVYDRKLA